LLDKLIDHITENRAHRVEPLIGLTDVGKANIVQQDLLHNENSNGFAQLRSGLHDAQAKWDYLGCQKKVDDFRRVILDEGANHAQRGKTKIFERSRLRCRVKKGVEEERNVRCECISSAILIPSP